MDESDGDHAGASAPRHLVVAFVIMLLVAGTLGVYSLPTALPDHPINIPCREELQPWLWIPQGWAFFTRDPRESTLSLYRVEEGVWVMASLDPGGRSANLFGLRRQNRAQRLEAAALLRRIAPSSWVEWRRDPVWGLAALATADTLDNHSPRSTLCGDVGFVQQEPIPWSWARSADARGVEAPSQLARVHVRCP